jgi:hypothetical protein
MAQPQQTQSGEIKRFRLGVVGTDRMKWFQGLGVYLVVHRRARQERLDDIRACPLLVLPDQTVLRCIV